MSHPTPPVFDGPEDRNGRRNHDEIRFWADYVRPGHGGYIYDDPKYDTADFADTAPGNLRADYVLPSKRLKVVDTGVFWPTLDDELSRLTGVFDFAQFLQDGIGFPTSDHRLVWLDIRVR